MRRYHGVDPKAASNRLHTIKFNHGMGGVDNVIFDLTGNVYNQLGEWIGTSTR